MSIGFITGLQGEGKKKKGERCTQFKTTVPEVLNEARAWFGDL
jgi:hypothetical protein